MELKKAGIVGRKAPELRVDHWIDPMGHPLFDRPRISDYSGKILVIYCFQYYCKGCHKYGFPALKTIHQHFADRKHEVEFLAIQTVFENPDENTREQIKKTQEVYQIGIPFGHDVGEEQRRFRANLLFDYRIGGTPWFIIVDRDGTVILNTYHIDGEKAINSLERLLR